MSMIICRECGKEISDMAPNCPNCGCPVGAKIPQETKPNKKEKKKDTTMSIWAGVLSIFGCTAFIGIILALVDLSKNDKEHRHSGSWLAIVMCVLYIFVFVFVLSGSDDETKIDNTAQVTETATQTTEPQNTETTETSETVEEEFVKPGGNFEVDGLKITVNECDLEYTEYEDEYDFYKLEDGLKYIRVSFDCQNNSQTDKYVSIYDYECYSDGNLCEQTYNFGGDFVNANLSSGRNVSFETFYIVPSDSQEIELEYTENIWTNDKIIIKLQ